VDQRLFLPEGWFTEAYAARRTKCQVPEGLTFRTTPQLAVEIWRDMYQEDLLSFKYMVADGLSGNSPAFIEAAEPCGGKIYFVSMPSETRCWVQGPVTQSKRDTSKGEARTKRVVRQTEKAPIAVAGVAKSIHDWFWYRRKVAEGTKGPIAYEFTKRQVMWCQESLPYKTVWLVMKRTLGEQHIYYDSISHAPVSTRLRTFVW
jgi:SRSO17 transposase